MNVKKLLESLEVETSTNLSTSLKIYLELRELKNRVEKAGQLLCGDGVRDGQAELTHHLTDVVVSPENPRQFVITLAETITVDELDTNTYESIDAENNEIPDEEYLEEDWATDSGPNEEDSIPVM